jgi:alpha-ribazole phosphatase
MNLYLIRHTITAAPEGVCYGQTDVDVLPSFEEEKEKVLEKIQHVEFDKIYTSPLKRCMKLSQAINSDKKKVIVDARLMELNFGLWEMKRWDDIEKTPEAISWFEDYVKIPCPAGEAYADLLKRAGSFLEDIKSNNDKNILIVCHGGIIRAFYSIINKVTPQEAFELSIGYGEVMELGIEV